MRRRDVTDTLPLGYRKMNRTLSSTSNWTFCLLCSLLLLLHFPVEESIFHSLMHRDTFHKAKCIVRFHFSVPFFAFVVQLCTLLVYFALNRLSHLALYMRHISFSMDRNIFFTYSPRRHRRISCFLLLRNEKVRPLAFSLPSPDPSVYVCKCIGGEMAENSWTAFKCFCSQKQHRLNSVRTVEVFVFVTFSSNKQGKKYKINRILIQATERSKKKNYSMEQRENYSWSSECALLYR